MNNNTPNNQGMRPVPPPPPSGVPGGNPADDRTRVRSVAKPEAPRPAPSRGGGGSGNGGGGGRKRRKKPSVAKYYIFNILKTALVIGCIALMIGSFIAVQVVQYVVEATSAGSDLDLDNLHLKMTSYIMAQNPETGEWEEYQELVGPEHRIWVPYDEIPEYLKEAIIATEDRTFKDNHGVNIERTAYAVLNEVFEFEDKSFGASTITQQLVKNITGDDVVIGEDGKTSGYMRKLREIFSAWGLTNRYSKDVILEAYLNTMSLSGTIAGVGAGAQMYFGKEAKDLTLWECATIAGITRAPTYYSPFTNPEVCLERRNNVIFFMLETGAITEAEAEHAYDQPLGINRQALQERQESSVFSYFSDTVFNEVVGDLIEQGHAQTRSEAINMIYTSGFRIYATVDLELQRAMEELFEHAEDEGGFLDTNFPAYRNQLKVTEDITNAAGNKIGEQDVWPQAAAASVRYDGSLAAVVGGFGPKTDSLSLNRAVQSVRQNGSTMKPVAAYSLGIDWGIVSYSSMLEDSPVASKNPYNPNRDPETGEVIYDWPRNFSQRYRGTGMPVVSAISESTNTIAVRVGQQVGEEDMFYFMKDVLQISSLVESGDRNDMGLAPLVLGSLTNGISPYELAGAYMMFGGQGADGNYGRFNSLHSYEYILDYNDTLFMSPQVSSVQAISPASGYVMNRMLSTVIRSNAPGVQGTAIGMMPKGEMDAVGKTGTTTDDNDRWFVGLTPYYVTAVWWGYDQLHDFYSQRWPAGARNNVPIHIWKNLMEQRQENMEVIEFPAMPDTVTVSNYCAYTGDLLGPGCPSGGSGYYSDSYVPDVCSGNHAPPEADPPAE